MQWLTAILAFATTMLIFAMVVSAIVEIIHRTLGSRTFGLIAMLEHYYDEVLEDYFDDEAQPPVDGVTPPATRINRKEFLQRMSAVRAPGISKSKRVRTTRKQSSGWHYISWFFGLIPYFFSLIPRSVKYLHSKISGTSEVASELGNSTWRLLSHLPVETFMERLGTLGFAEVLKKNIQSEEEKHIILKDIAQKFELFGRESALYFQTKARMISMIIAVVVAWTFYVHPYDLLQTYMTNPEAAARVAQMSDNVVSKFEAQKKILVTLKESDNETVNSKEIEELLNEIDQELAKGRAQATLLNDAGAPVGWPVDFGKMHQYECFCGDSTGKYSCQKRTSGVSQCGLIVNVPNASKDIFWLLIGGVLIGLGAPFWAKTIAQIARVKNEGQNISSILQPESDDATGLSLSAVKQVSAPTEPLTTKAFNAAADARKLKLR